MVFLSEISVIFCSIKKIKYIMNFFLRIKISILIQNMQIRLHVCLLSCSCLLVWFWTFKQIHIIYLFYLIISANLSHLTEAQSSVIWKAVQCVNKESINLGHSEPERAQCRKRMGNTVHTREGLAFGLWFSDAQMPW